MRSEPSPGNPRSMQFNESMTETVLFELPSKYYAEELLLNALSERVSWLQIGEDASVVGVMLAPDELDLARLLRSVQDWLEHSGLLAIRFEVDERTYVLEAPLPVLAYA